MTAREKFINPECEPTSISTVELEELIELQSDILGATVTSSDSDELLERLCLLAEKLTPGSLASVMLYDNSKEQLFVHTAPSIPPPVIKDLNGLRKGEGSCGNAIYYNEDMYVCDTLNDARWQSLQGFATKYNINSCWSSPIQDLDSEATGSFALSSFTIRTPDNFQRRLLKICASIAGIIFQQKKADIASEQSRNQLQESKEELAVTLNSIADGVISTDFEGRIVVFNRVAEKLTGYTNSEAVGRHIDDVFNVVDNNNERICNPVQCLLTEQLCYKTDGHTLLIAADGHSRYIEISEAAVKNEAGEITGAVLAFRDITQQRIDHEALIESEQRFRSILENTADPLFLVNENAEFVDVNQMACDSLGYSREELLSMQVKDIQLKMPEESFRTFFNKLDMDASICIVGEHQRKDGSHFPVEIRIRKFLCNGQMFNVALASDISGRKEAEEELLKARKLESIGLLAGGIAHDFNNLLGIIVGNIDLARRNEKLGDNMLRYLNNASNASKRATDLTQQLLTFSKGGEPIKKASNIVDIIRESTEFSLHGSNISVSYFCSDDLWAVNVDSGQISQVIQNLVINARQAMPNGGQITVRCMNKKVSSTTSEYELDPGLYVKITISDNGAGIPEEIINSVFDPYFTTKQDGSGLGLALSYSIINKHKGSISLTSTVGSGTTFTVFLPASSEAVTTDISNMEYQSGSQGSARILVMDDDEMIREIGEAMLENLGYEVLLAVDGEQAFDIYRKALSAGKRIDLVIMDLTVLSGIGGKQAIKMIQGIDPDIKALVSSGYSNDDVMANYSRYGFIGAVGKPYNQDEMGAAISAALKI